MMSLLKSYWFWLIIGMVSSVGMILIESISTLGFLMFYILAPFAFGMAARMFLDLSQFETEETDVECQVCEEATAHEHRVPVILWN